MSNISTSAPVGFGVAAPGALAKPSVLLSDNIDPVTNDYKSLFETIDTIDAQVIIALKIVRNSGAAVVNDGNTLRSIRKINNGIEVDIISRVRQALARLVSNGDIRYENVIFDIIDPGNQTVQARVQYVNLRAFDPTIREASIVVGSDLFVG